MRRAGFLLLLALLTAGGAVVWAYRSGVLGAGEPSSAVERHEPAPGSPPVVWIDGTLEHVGETSITLRQGRGSTLELRRLAAGATSFHERVGDGWREREPGNDTRGPVCVEALLDDSLVALRVFLDARSCAPE